MVTMRKAALHGGFGAGVGASIAMMAVMAIIRFISNTTSLPELMENSLTHLTGGQVEAFFINNLGVGGKALLLVSIVEGTLILGGLLGLGFTHLWQRVVGMQWPRYVSGLLYGLLVGLLLNVVFLTALGQGFFGANALSVTAPPDISRTLYGDALAPWGLPAWLNMFLLALVFGLALVWMLKWPATATARDGQVAQPALTGSQPMARRDFNKALTGGVVALFGGAALWVIIRQALQPPPNAGLQEIDLSQQPTVAPDTSAANPTATAGTAAQAGPTATASANHQVESNPTAGMAETPPTPPIPAGFENVKAVLPPQTTPVESFYITTKNFIDPTVDGNSWTLSFSGMVDNPYTINLADVLKLPVITRSQTLACISNPVGGDLIGNADWKGVDFAELLKKAKPKSGVQDVVVRAADGYADSFPIDVALNNGVVLAYEMNGAPLTSKHGYPARLLVPNIYGMKNCKWITEVELVGDDFKGYWESQGWDDVAIYNTMSRIDYPNEGNISAKPVYVGGVAFAGNRGIKRVEVTTDEGKTWGDAQIRLMPGKLSWVLWTYPWDAKKGVYTLQVRATDGTGAVQTGNEADTYPAGATGYHTRVVRVG